MSASYKFSLVSPRGKAVEGDVESVVLPGADGDLGVLAGHAPLICALRRGIAQVTRAGRTEFFVTGEGVLEVSLTGVHVLLRTAFDGSGGLTGAGPRVHEDAPDRNRRPEARR